MTRDEAIAFLAACKPLADRLAEQGVDIELTDADQTEIAGYSAVAATGWLEDPDVNQQASLSYSDIATLNFMVAQLYVESMRRQQDIGEQSPD